MHEPEQAKPLTPEARTSALDTFLDGQPLAVGILKDPVVELMLMVRRMDGTSGDYDIQIQGKESSASARIDPNGNIQEHEPLYLATRTLKNTDDILRALPSAERMDPVAARAAIELFDGIDLEFRADPEGMLLAFQHRINNILRPEILSLEPYHRADIEQAISGLVLSTDVESHAILDGEYLSIQFQVRPEHGQINVFLITPEERALGELPLDDLNIVFEHNTLNIVLENTTTGEIIEPVRSDMMIEFVGIQVGDSYRPLLRNPDEDSL